MKACPRGKGGDDDENLTTGLFDCYWNADCRLRDGMRQFGLQPV